MVPGRLPASHGRERRAVRGRGILDQQGVPSRLLKSGLMLASLTVRDIVLIERAQLNFGPGLNGLTGESGAGKSILLDALGVPPGERAQGQLTIRRGADQTTPFASHPPRPRPHARTSPCIN